MTINKKSILLGVIGICGAVGLYSTLQKPSHDYEVDTSLMVEKANYESCIKVSFGIIDGSNIDERKADALACLNALDNKNFFIDSDGSALVFVSRDEYYRVAPSVLELYKSKSSSMLSAPPFPTEEPMAEKDNDV